MATLGGVFGSLLSDQHVSVLPKFDCVLQDVWNKFRLNGAAVDLDANTIETAIRNYLSEKPEATLTMDLRVQFLLFLTRLVDGEHHYLFQYDPSPDIATYSSTVLESAFRIFNQLLQTFPERKKQTEPLLLKILQQAVFVCCRRCNFALAKNVYEFAELEVNVDEVVWEELKMVVESEDASHPVLTENSYQEFCKLMSEKLDFLVSSLDLQECAQGCAVHRRSVRYTGEHRESNDKFDKEMLRKLLHMNIESWLPNEHRTILEKEFLKQERLSDYDVGRAAHSINEALCQMNLRKELPADKTFVSEFDKLGAEEI